MSAPGPSMRPQCRGVPAGFHGYSAALTHPDFKAGKKALELAQSASEQIVNVASLRNARSKVERRGIGVALDDRHLVEVVAQNTRGAHARQTAADHQSASGGHGQPSTRRRRERQNASSPALIVVMDLEQQATGLRFERSVAHPGRPTGISISRERFATAALRVITYRQVARHEILLFLRIVHEGIRSKVAGIEAEQPRSAACSIRFVDIAGKDLLLDA